MPAPRQLGQVLQAAQHGRPPIVVPHFVRSSSTKPSTAVGVVVRALQVAQEQLAGAARAHDQRAHAHARAPALGLREPDVGEAAREAEGADEAGGEEELDHHHRARRAQAQVLGRALQEVEDGHEGRAADQRRLRSARTASWKPESRKDQRWMPKKTCTDSRNTRSTGRWRRNWRTRSGGIVAVEAQQEGQVEGEGDQHRVEQEQGRLALAARQAQQRLLRPPRPSRGRLHAAAPRPAAGDRSRARTARHSAANRASAASAAANSNVVPPRQPSRAAAVSSERRRHRAPARRRDGSTPRPRASGRGARGAPRASAPRARSGAPA